MGVGIWIYRLLKKKKKQPFGCCGSIVLFLWYIGWWTILDVLWWVIVANGALTIVTLQLHIFTLFCCAAPAVECPCPRWCFSPLALQPSKPLQLFVFALPFCQMRYRLINTTLGLYINSWQARWPIIPLMNANGPSHSEPHSDTDAHAPLNMHTRIWIRLSTSRLYYFVALMNAGAEGH